MGLSAKLLSQASVFRIVWSMSEQSDVVHNYFKDCYFSAGRELAERDV